MKSKLYLKPYLLGGVVSTGLLAASLPVMAQEAVLEEIVVTAQRTESSLQKTPIAVTAYDANALQERGIDDLADLGTFAPSLTITARPGAGPARSSFSMRGMSVNAENGSAAVGVYVDEVYFASAYGNSLGLLDTERVEILRGPQGTLFGRNTIAGAVQYVTVKPQDKFEGYATATVGNLDRQHLEGVLNLPLGDIVALRVAASTDKMGGYVYDQLNDIKRGESNTDLGRIQLRIKPIDDLTIDLKAELGKMDTNGRPALVSGFNPLAQFALLSGITAQQGAAFISTEKYSTAGFNAPDAFTGDQKSYSANIAWNITDGLQLKSISAYADNESELVTDLDDTPLPLLSGSRGVTTDKVFTQEFQLNGKAFEESLSWTAGVYYYHNETTKVDQTTVIGGAIISRVNDTKDDVKSKAIYAQATYKITDPFSVTVGLRYSKEDIDSDVTRGSGNVPTKPAPYSVSNSFDDTSPYLGFNYQLNPDVMLYVKGSKGFRAGGVTLNDALLAANTQGQYDNGGVGFGPETAWTYEAGARMEFLDRRLRVNPTVFYTKWKDIQFNQLVILPPSAGAAAILTLNAGDAENKGFELETQWAATRDLLFTASASYLDAKYTRVGNIVYSPFPFFGPNGPILEPNLGVEDDLQQAPKYKFSVGGQYTQPLSSGASVVGSLDYGWTDKQNSSVTRTDRELMPAYGLLNGRLSYNSVDNHWSVALYGTNLLDKYYLIGATGFGRGYTIGFDERDPGRPREYGLTLRFNFN